MRAPVGAENMHFYTLRPCNPNFWAHIDPTQGIITCPNHEVTLDTFVFLVGAHSTAWWAVTRYQMAEGALRGPKMQYFWPKIIFFGAIIQYF